MLEFISQHYLWVKALHYAGFISWMAALFYLPRLFVYHSEHKDNTGFVSVVKVQERKLFKGIAMPAMIVTLLTAFLMLAANPILMKQPHIHAKLTLALLLLVYHFDNWRFLRQLQNDRCQRSGRFFRAYNEIPTLFMLAILVVMIVRVF
ncbi:protoporphyrinogen oxidase HemJ [Campylobacter sp. MIT 12-5580]|uniref:protoporphyrinogen oxidase HemJ n=1 Tax=Campylobacter sp. MIT 12-5580 TaxID=2040651 RepID=UPI0010F6EA81|nr:protoporphyrinogen oxidase HemJ [Campylobacter sp. MIT 12-5580]TKX28544.1 protoporphyrinogen oxidase HemJ [Campylobacter sp. MIT 12-5580]